jgi:hypothetical protein
MRQVNARISNFSFWILLFHLSSLFTSGIAFDARIKRP